MPTKKQIAKLAKLEKTHKGGAKNYDKLVKKSSKILDKMEKTCAHIGTPESETREDGTVLKWCGACGAPQ